MCNPAKLSYMEAIISSVSVLVLDCKYVTLLFKCNFPGNRCCLRANMARLTTGTNRRPLRTAWQYTFTPGAEPGLVHCAAALGPKLVYQYALDLPLTRHIIIASLCCGVNGTN
jgi:hypothetical protein